MKARWKLPWAMLALWAMLATLLPQTLWACPMTGRVSTASRMCQDMAAQGMAPMTNASIAKAAPCTKCCHPIPVPAAEDDDSQANSTFTASSHVWTSFALAAPTFEVVPFVVSFSLAPQSHPEPLPIEQGSHSPPPLWTQHHASPQAGRAPPRA